MFYCTYIYDIYIDRKVFLMRVILQYFYEFIFYISDVEGETPKPLNTCVNRVDNFPHAVHHMTCQYKDFTRHTTAQFHHK